MKSMLQWVKSLFTVTTKEYEGSSDTFSDAYQQAKYELSKPDCNSEIVMDLLDIMLALMTTRGDGRLITAIQTQLRLKSMKETYA